MHIVCEEQGKCMGPMAKLKVGEKVGGSDEIVEKDL
jgi:hypothetical protein